MEGPQEGVLSWQREPGEPGLRGEHSARDPGPQVPAALTGPIQDHLIQRDCCPLLDTEGTAGEGAGRAPPPPLRPKAGPASPKWTGYLRGEGETGEALGHKDDPLPLGTLEGILQKKVATTV